MRALVVDDQAVNRILLIGQLEGMGYSCVEAENGKQAIEQFKLSEPDLVMMNIMMPVMNGYEAAAELRKLVTDRHIPIIFLTANRDEDSLLKGLESGGDDFLHKPVNPVLLELKIQAHRRTQRLTDELIQNGAELEAMHSTLQAEHELGNHVLSHALSKNLTHSENIRSYLVAQSTFNGDILLSAQKPLGGLYVFLGDITGHGLAAAIGTIPLSQVFFTMTRKGKPSGSIIREMNRSLRAFVPRSMFCAAVLLELDAAGQKMKVWNGGLPLCSHIQRSKQQVEVLSSNHLPLGVLESESFDATMFTINLEEGDSVLMLTDGIPESINSSKEMFGLDRVEQLVVTHQGDSFEELLRQYADFAGASSQDDDVSLVEVLAISSKPSSAELMTTQSIIPWATSIRLDAHVLRDLHDPVQAVMQLLPERLEFAVYYERIATVVTELYSNALEHGILGLDSKLKRGSEGFEKYYTLREEALAKLTDGEIEIKWFFDPINQRDSLGLTVTDSGDGFRHDANTPSALNGDDERAFGRGVTLVESLCSSVVYNDLGNEVTVLIRLN